MCSIPHARLERPGGSGRSSTIRSGHHAVWIRGPWIELASPAPPQRREERRGTAQEGRQSAPLSSRVRFRLLALLLPAALVWPSTAATDTDSSQEQVERPSPPLPPSPSSLEAGSSAPPWAWVWPTVALALLALVLSAALCWMHTQMRGMRMAFVPSDPVQHHAGSAVFAPRRVRTARHAHRGGPRRGSEYARSGAGRGGRGRDGTSFQLIPAHPSSRW